MDVNTPALLNVITTKGSNKLYRTKVRHMAG